MEVLVGKRPSFGEVFLFGRQSWTALSELVAAETWDGETAVFWRTIFAVREVRLAGSEFVAVRFWMWDGRFLLKIMRQIESQK